MKNTFKNGSNRETGALLPDESHPEFLTLCAFATAGSLSAEDESRLAEHLLKCAACRKVIAQYEAIAGRVLPTLAGEAPDINLHDGSASWSLIEAEAALFARLDAEDQKATDVQDGSSENASASHTETEVCTVDGDTLWRHIWWQYAAGLILVAALGFSLYRTGIRQGREVTEHSFPASPPTPAQNAEIQPSNPHAILSGTEENDYQILALRARIEDQSKEIARLTANQAQIGNDRDAKAVDADRLSRESAELAQQLTVARGSLQDVQQQLNISNNQSAANAAEMAGLEARIIQLSDRLHERDQEVAREQVLLDHDRDIRELMGARDLYIAEVYDVARTGDTEKPFGRVFYTKGQSLIFYAYDLDQQPGLKTASTFQAWGRRGTDTGQAVNLGILFQDNASRKRWVLKARNLETLGEIDAVFVTVEPKGGSTHPSGKPFLFAYLGNDPNHP